jgi:DNA end-binding protein Ku
MRSIWKGAISFGLVTIPVKLYSATEEKNVSFHQVHRDDGGRIRYKRVCSVDGEEVSYGDIAKGYELSSGETVILTDEDFADLPLSSSRTIDVLQFVPLEQVDPIYFAKSYYLEPERTGTKPYVLLRDALEQSDKVAVVKVALRQREQLATLRVRDGVFVLETMLWPDEIRAPEFGFLDEDVEVRPQELTMAGSLIDSLTAEFDPSQYTDEYREALEAVISAKVEGQEIVQPAAEQPQGGAVLDLMAALRASVEAAKGNKGSGGSASGNLAVDDSSDADGTDEAEVQSAPKKASARRKKPDESDGSTQQKTPRKKAGVKSAEKADADATGKAADKVTAKAAPRKRKSA